MKKFLLLIFVLLSLQMFAQEKWAKIAESKQVIMYIHNFRMSWNGNVCTVWIKSTLKNDEIRSGFVKIAIEHNLSFDQIQKWQHLDHDISIQEYDCVQKRCRTLNRNYYTNDGELIETTEIPTDWNYVVPDSINETTLNTICKSKSTKETARESKGKIN